jgi:hypothetical protein
MDNPSPVPCPTSFVVKNGSSALARLGVHPLAIIAHHEQVIVLPLLQPRWARIRAPCEILGAASPRADAKLLRRRVNLCGYASIRTAPVSPPAAVVRGEIGNRHGATLVLQAQQWQPVKEA